MSNRIRFVLVVTFLLVAFACAGERPAPPAETDELAIALERAEQAAAVLGGELMQRLLTEMEAGGATQAVRICSEEAQELASAHSTDGLIVRRVSLKARNPADAPDEFEREALLELEKLHRQGQLPAEITEVTESAEGRTLRFLRPIVIMPSCLPCHGPTESVAPEVARLIAERYPEDRAMGYASGDLRGAISVTVPID